MKRFLMVLIILLFIGIGIYYYQNKTIECWWGVCYPSLSFIAFENEEEDTTVKFSALDKDYIPDTIEKENQIKYKWFIIKWWKEKFGQIAQ